jgi:hypothetical protein
LNPSQLNAFSPRGFSHHPDSQTIWISILICKVEGTVTTEPDFVDAIVNNPGLSRVTIANRSEENYEGCTGNQPSALFPLQKNSVLFTQ